jgi:hypothetical protein
VEEGVDGEGGIEGEGLAGVGAHGLAAVAQDVPLAEEKVEGVLPGARCAPAEIPTPSSSLARRTRVISGSSSARVTRWTSQVSGSTESRRTPHAFRAS